MVKDHSDTTRGNPLLPHGLLFSISSKGSFICTIQDRIAHTTAFVIPVVEHWLEREIAQSCQWVHSMKDRSDDLSHHERMLLPRSYISLLYSGRNHVQWNYTPSIELVLAGDNFFSVGMFHLKQLSCQLVDNGNLWCRGVHLVLEAFETVLHYCKLFNVICHNDRCQELLLQVQYYQFTQYVLYCLVICL